MALIFLRIHNLRNLQQVELKPAAGINLFLGENGSGKTSLLEAICILGRGRSFRGDRAGPLIAHGKEYLEVFGQTTENGTLIQNIGVRKTRGEMKIKVNGSGVRKLSILARNLPQVIITPRSHEILERGPEYRRRFMDWGVFHVEHGFLNAAKNYKKVLRQRNIALKSTGNDAKIWNVELIKNGMLIDSYRMQYLESLTERFNEIVAAFLPGRTITLSYKRTAETENEYLEKLERHWVDEKKRGFTQVGPHRSDLSVVFEGKNADKVASRGEQKLLIAALFLAQAKMVSEKGGKKPILLIDDLPAELDSKNRALFIAQLESLNTQVFITGTEIGLFSALPEAQVFHVEHGVLS